MIGGLPSSQALAQFYQVFIIMAIITAAIVSWVMVRHHDPTPSPYPRAYRWMVWGLGGLWVVDGLLQAQPLMVTRFIGGFLAPLTSGQPAPLSQLIGFSARIWTVNPIACNEIATWVQIGIGLLILLGGQSVGRRIGLWASIVWGTAVWVFGEALGSLFVSGSWLSGTPGSVLFYVLMAVLLLYPGDLWNKGTTRKILRVGFAGLWFLSAILQAWPPSGWWTSGALASYVISMAEMPQPDWASYPLYAWGHALALHPAFWNGLMVAVFLLLALLWTFRPQAPLTWWSTLIVGFATWWLGQDFGILGGMGTDPNSGIMVLLALAVYAVPQWALNPARSNRIGANWFGHDDGHRQTTR